jgi:hypothetical protein
MKDLREQAFAYAASVAYDLGNALRVSFTEAAEILIKDDPVRCVGENSERREIRFDWSFSGADVPEIARRAKALSDAAEEIARRFLA